jgi:hypothetical protein
VIFVVDQQDRGEVTLLGFAQVMQDLQASHAGHFEAGDEERWDGVVQSGICNESENVLSV